MGGARFAGRAVARPRRDGRHDHPVHDAVCPARRAVEADAGRAQYAESGGVVDDVEGRPHVRVRPAKEQQVPQRRSGDGRGRQILVRALPGRGRQADQGQGPRSAGRRPGPRAVSPEGTLARFPDLLRHHGRGCWVDRPPEIRRAGRRGWLQEGAHWRRPVPARLVHTRDRARGRGIRGVLAQSAERPAARVQGHARRYDPRRRPQEG